MNRCRFQTTGAGRPRVEGQGDEGFTDWDRSPEVDREIAMRQRVYPGADAQGGKLRQPEATFLILQRIPGGAGRALVF